MKRFISALLLILIITTSCASLISCGNTPYVEGEGELNIVATCFPAFDFAREIAGDNATIKLLQHNGEDMHDFFPTTATLTALKDADIFICVGGSSDNTWLSDALDSCNNPDLTVIKLLDYVTPETPALNGHNKNEYCTENHTDLIYGSLNGALSGALQGAINGDKNFSENFDGTTENKKEYDYSYKYETENGEVKYGYIDENGKFVEIKPGENGTGENGTGDNFSVIVGGSSDGSVKYEGSITNKGENSVIVGGTNGGNVQFEYVTGTDGNFAIIGGITATTTDEHVWASPKAVIKMAEAIAQACMVCDGGNEVFYNKRLDAFKSALSQLDLELTEAVNASAHKTLVFADRFPFVYLTQDYGICYYSAYAGCDANANASFETQVKLTETMKKHSLPGVIVLENSDTSLAENVISGTNGRIFQLNSLQSVTDDLIEGGMTYLGIMRDNLNVLKEALK